MGACERVGLILSKELKFFWEVAPLNLKVGEMFILGKCFSSG